MIFITALCMALASCTNANSSSDNASGAADSGSTAAAASESGSADNSEKSDASGSSGAGEKSDDTDSSDNSDSTASAADASDMFTDRDHRTTYSDTVNIQFSSGAGAVSGSGAEADGGNITITEEGTYLISGKTEGQIIVDAPDDAKIQIVLDGAEVTCSGSAALYVKNADKVFVTTAAGSTNSLTSKGEFVQTDDNNVDGSVFAKSDITFNGEGTLDISCETAHGVVCKDDIKFTSGTFTITSAKKGIDCKESVRAAGGDITINSGTDGIHAENTDKPEKAFVYICGGTFSITSGQDGIDAGYDVTVSGGEINIVSDGGAANASPNRGNDFGMRWDRETTTSDGTTESAKGIKSDTLILIDGGTLNIDSSDDTIHSNGNADISGGELTLSSGDDGVHADDTVTISDGKVTVTASYEGIEGEVIEISGGDVDVTASDDGMNAAGGETTSGWGMMDVDENALLHISGGNITVNADGDGLDSNGKLLVSGGTTFVSGPTNSGNGALDSGTSATITGGYIIAAGAVGMAENFDSESTQGSILYTFDSTLPAGTTISLSDSSGNTIISYTPVKTFQCAVISAPEITSGSTYTLTAGDSTYSVEMTSNIYGASNGMGGFGGGMGGGFGGGRMNGGGRFNSGSSADSGSSSTDGSGEPTAPGDGEMPEMPDDLDGERPDFANGERPEMPDNFNGEMPDFANGERPEMPDGSNGEMPGFANGERPEMPGGFGGGQRPDMQNGEAPDFSNGGGFGGRGQRGGNFSGQTTDTSQT